MKKIWIREGITLRDKIIMSSLFILLVLTAWISVTTVRMPPKKISNDIFNLIIQNILLQSNRDLLNSYYNNNTENSVHILNDGINNRDAIIITGILRGSGYFYKISPNNPVISPNVLPHPLDIIKSFPSLFMGSSTDSASFKWKNSLLYAVWVSLRRELIAFLLVIAISIPLGVLMSCNKKIRSFFHSGLTIGSFIPVAALIPLTLAFFGIDDRQKVIFLALGMFFVLLGLVIKEIDEVDDIFLQTAYTLGFGQLKTIVFVLLPTAMPRIWKHFSAVFGLGWGLIIFAEMINSGDQDGVNGIGWLFIVRQRRFKIPEMYAIFFVIIVLAFVFSYLFKLGSRLLFKYENNH